MCRSEWPSPWFRSRPIAATAHKPGPAHPKRSTTESGSRPCKSEFYVFSFGFPLENCLPPSKTRWPVTYALLCYLEHGAKHTRLHRLTLLVASRDQHPHFAIAHPLARCAKLDRARGLLAHMLQDGLLELSAHAGDGGNARGCLLHVNHPIRRMRGQVEVVLAQVSPQRLRRGAFS